MIPVAVISFNYAPYNVTGTFRILKFVKHMPDYGLRPIVITAEQGDHHTNCDLLKDIPANCKVYRFKSIFPDSQQLYKDSGFFTSEKKPLLKRILYLLKDIFLSPDIQMTWVLLNFFKILRIIHKEKVKTILITAAPFSLFVLGSMIKLFKKVNLIYDYRDCWHSDIRQQHQSVIRKYLNRKIETMTLKKADAIVTTTDHILSETLKLCPKKRGIVIPTGFDPSDFIEESDQNLETNDCFCFFYSGWFRFNDKIYDPTLLLKAMDVINQTYKIKIIICGNVLEETISELKEKHPYLDFRGFIPRTELIRLAMTSDALIQYCYPTKMKDVISFKMFEYSQYGKPVVSINSKESEIARFLEESRTGFSCENDDLDEMIKLIDYVIRCDKKRFKEQINHKMLDKMSVKNSVHTLSDLIKSLEHPEKGK